jgi:hypothetical protein
MTPVTFPKLRYPIHTKGLCHDDELILLAYDAIYRAKIAIEVANGSHNETLLEDLDANLANLGAYIEHIICGGDMKLRFEGYDHL